MFINSKYISPYFLNFTYSVKTTNLYDFLSNYDPVRKIYVFWTLTNNFTLEVLCEYIEPVENTLLENIHSFKFNHKLSNLNRNCYHKFFATIKKS